MPWEEVTKMKSKLEFVRFALEEQHPFNKLCKMFKISRKTGYKLLNNYKQHGEEGLKERSRRPHNSPHKTELSIEDKILALRKRKPCWGGRKIRAVLINQNETNIPASSTITDILHRHKMIEKSCVDKLKNPQRFEHEAPNDLWQADFKGHFAMHKGRCHPLTIIDDHSRFSIGLRACDNERGETVKKHFIEIFEEYGLPYRINFDNGTPWAYPRDRTYKFTEFSTWLIRLGIRVSFSKIRHPQTNGKDERFHRTLKDELLKFRNFWDIRDAQKHFDPWRDEYNFERPHEALNMKPPISRYVISSRKYPEKLPEIEYSEKDIIRRVDSSGVISYKNKSYFLSESLKGLPVALREWADGKFNVYFCHQKIRCIDITLD